MTSQSLAIIMIFRYIDAKYNYYMYCGLYSDENIRMHLKFGELLKDGIFHYLCILVMSFE